MRCMPLLLCEMSVSLCGHAVCSCRQVKQFCLAVPAALFFPYDIEGILFIVPKQTSGRASNVLPLVFRCFAETISRRK